MPCTYSNCNDIFTLFVHLSKINDELMMMIGEIKCMYIIILLLMCFLPAIRGANWRGIYSTVFCLFVFFVRSTISQQPAGRFTPNFACGRSLGRDVSSLHLGSATPGGGKKRGNEIRLVSFLNRTATISVYLSVTKCGRISRAHTCTHSGVEP